ncbi:aminotransferase [Varunaivibrio sulfuroxidans]|uniref:aminotransferase n=1 Tax=Varunaivibrio sulfuroxidans TaxID=1773489 RepID=UPI00104973AA|nr:aminotransferase [Varunaivibrio sulfuroxidans]WES31238.1 aminotransferase [Varunaivibrio sulfuroxidans]
MKKGNTILSGYATTIFTVMSALANEHDAINLGQGYPDEDGPRDIRRRAADAVFEGPNQYPPMMGTPQLRRAVAAHNARFYGLDIDPDTEVIVTSGATEALCDSLLGLIEPGDEVVLIEPLYDSYAPIVRLAGGVAKTVRMEPPRWTLPREALAAAFSDKTKLIVLNSPHNPSGKVFDRDELSFIAMLLKKHDAYAVCDEVYEHLVFDGLAHIPLMCLEDMRDRCVRIGSAGKTFSLTGWKVGYITASPELIAPIAKAHQFVTFTTAPHLQSAVAYGLAKEAAYFSALAQTMQDKRDRLTQGLRAAGFEVMAAHGSYFITADIRSVGHVGGDVDFCRHITIEAGVTAVPVSAFYEGGGADHFVRFCFCKNDATLDEACRRLQKHFARSVPREGTPL